MNKKFHDFSIVFVTSKRHTAFLGHYNLHKQKPNFPIWMWHTFDVKWHQLHNQKQRQLPTSDNKPPPEPTSRILNEFNGFVTRCLLPSKSTFLIRFILNLFMAFKTTNSPEWSHHCEDNEANFSTSSEDLVCFSSRRGWKIITLKKIHISSIYVHYFLCCQQPKPALLGRTENFREIRLEKQNNFIFYWLASTQASWICRTACCQSFSLKQLVSLCCHCKSMWSTIYHPLFRPPRNKGLAKL